MISILRGLAASDFGTVTVRMPSESWRGDRVGVDVAGQVGPELELAGATRAAVAAAAVAVLGLGDLAGDDQLTVLELNVNLVLVHPG